VGKKTQLAAVSLVTLESHKHFVGDIEKGVKLYQGGGVVYDNFEPKIYQARVPHKYGPKVVSVVFTEDGRDVKKFICDCTIDYKKPPVCRHVVAAVLAIQGGIVESKLNLGKTATLNAMVDNNNTAKTVGSGSLDVLATPMVIALMEQAACNCLADALEQGETSVGTEISITHTAASPIGAEVTATAEIERVSGRTIEFIVTARDNSGEIGKGKHTRVIVEAAQFLKKAAKRL